MFCVCACSNFSDTLLSPVFDAKRLDVGAGKVRLKLLGDSLCIVAATSRDDEIEVEPYTEMVLSFVPPILTLTSSETKAAKRFEISAVDGPGIVAELDDRIQLARHVSDIFCTPLLLSIWASGTLTTCEFR